MGKGDSRLERRSELDFIYLFFHLFIESNICFFLPFIECMAKENINKMKREPTVWENTFANDTLDKGLISKIYKELI